MSKDVLNGFWVNIYFCMQSNCMKSNFGPSGHTLICHVGPSTLFARKECSREQVIINNTSTFIGFSCTGSTNRWESETSDSWMSIQYSYLADVTLIGQTCTLFPIVSVLDINVFLISGDMLDYSMSTFIAHHSWMLGTWQSISLKSVNGRHCSTTCNLNR